MTEQTIAELLGADMAQSIINGFIVGLIINVLCLIACPIIAGWKGRNVAGWIFGGLFLNLIGLIIVACLPGLRTRRCRGCRYYDYYCDNCDDYDDDYED